MKPAFEEHKVEEALKKIMEVLNRPSSGLGAPSWAEANTKDVIKALEKLQDRVRVPHMNEQHGGLPIAIYAARELDKCIAGARSDIPNRDAAEVFVRCLRSLIDELRPLDVQLAKEEAA